MLNKLMVAERDEARTAHDAFNRSSIINQFYVCLFMQTATAKPARVHEFSWKNDFFVHTLCYFRSSGGKTQRLLSNEHGRLKAKAQLIFRFYLVPRFFQSPSR